jgi:hypothetical protein
MVISGAVSLPAFHAASTQSVSFVAEPLSSWLIATALASESYEGSMPNDEQSCFMILNLLTEMFINVPYVTLFLFTFSAYA